MLDFPAMDQGSGLRRLAMRQAPPVLSVLHHGDHVAELTLLWQLCSALQSHGYGVNVLDGTAQETPGNPGLLDMLLNPYSPQPAGRAGRWTVIPSSLGLQQIKDAPASSKTLERLSRWVPDGTVLIVYASAQDLFALQGLQQRCIPVLGFSPELQSLLSAYQCVKQLASWAALTEVIAVTVSPSDSPEYLADAMVKSLQNCTMNFLNCPVRHVSTQLNMHEPMPSDQVPEGIRQLALQLLNPLSPVAAQTGAAASRISDSARPKAVHDQRLWSH